MEGRTIRSINAHKLNGELIIERHKFFLKTPTQNDMKSIKDIPQHALPEERGLAAFQAHQLFPGRTSLRVRDVAQALGVTRQQVVDLIEEYRETDGRSGLGAINVASGLHRELRADSSGERRCQWRIPVAAFDVFIGARTNRQPVRIGRPATANKS